MHAVYDMNLLVIKVDWLRLCKTQTLLTSRFLRFTSSDKDMDIGQVFTGFRLLFTFHPMAALPEMRSDGRWNCSVPHWPEFQQHFVCNLKADCVEGEDEELCPYYSEACGKGRVIVGSKCYVYTADKGLSWDAASVECLLLGGMLAAPKTEEEWVGLGRLVDYDPDFYRVYIGLRSTSPILPFL